MAWISGRSTEPEQSVDVAKIVLFTITGAIVAVFVAVMVIGAIRAYRHPERYMPEGTAVGSKVNRAKGITRAILDTIPVIKFTEDGKRVSARTEEVEIHSYQKTSPRVEENDHQGRRTWASDFAASASTSQGPASDDAQPTDEDGRLGCSICTEPFNIGDQIRMLPCGHKYHPSCVDPWLLNMSSTCPLCRIELDSQAHPEGKDAQRANTSGPTILPPGDRA